MPSENNCIIEDVDIEVNFLNPYDFNDSDSFDSSDDDDENCVDPCENKSFVSLNENDVLESFTFGDESLSNELANDLHEMLCGDDEVNIEASLCDLIDIELVNFHDNCLNDALYIHDLIGAMYPLVPLILEKCGPLVSLLNNLDNPKSMTLGLKSESKRMFCGFTSQCKTHSKHSSCKYAKPFAVPTAISYLVSQSSLFPSSFLQTFNGGDSVVWEFPFVHNPTAPTPNLLTETPRGLLHLCIAELLKPVCDLPVTNHGFFGDFPGFNPNHHIIMDSLALEITANILQEPSFLRDFDTRRLPSLSSFSILGMDSPWSIVLNLKSSEEEKWPKGLRTAILELLYVVLPASHDTSQGLGQKTLVSPNPS
nr:hypothetical protein Iba_chr15bCG4030 [Ipomoea batatas]